MLVWPQKWERMTTQTHCKWFLLWWSSRGTHEIEDAESTAGFPHLYCSSWPNPPLTGDFYVSASGGVPTSAWGYNIRAFCWAVPCFHFFLHRWPSACPFQSLRQDTHSCVIDCCHSRSCATLNLFINISAESSYCNYHNCQRHDPCSASRVGKGRMQEILS